MSTPAAPHDGAPSGRRPHPVLRALALSAVTASTLVVALILLGTFVPGIPGIGFVGSFIGQLVLPWSIVVALLCAGVTSWLWSRRRTWFRSVIGVIAIGTILAGGLVVVRQVTAADEGGASVNPVALGGAAGSAPDSQVVYLTDQGQDLHLSVYRPTLDTPQGQAPVFVYVHGGGWVSGTPDDTSADLRWFADQGYVVFSVEYSLSDDQRHLWNVQDRQVGCALSWVTAHAAEHGGDADRLYAGGESAGGNLIINATYRTASGTLDPSCAGPTPTVKAIAPMFPGVDLVEIHASEDVLIGGRLRTWVEQYIGGPPQQFPDRYTSVNSTTTITAAAPPTLIMWGTNDHFVPPATMESFAEQARSAGIDIKTVALPYLDHGFFTGPIGRQAYRQITLQWLLDHP